jgi:hypothetical protein
MTDNSLTMSDRLILDNIITSTSADIVDLKESQDHLREVEASAYLSRSPKYAMSDEFIGWGSNARTKGNEDISWLADISTDFESDRDWDSHLIALANTTVSSLDKNLLSDKNFVTEVENYAIENIPSNKRELFSSYLEAAISMKLDEPEAPVTKEASVKDYSDVDDAALYM